MNKADTVRHGWARVLDTLHREQNAPLADKTRARVAHVGAVVLFVLGTLLIKQTFLGASIKREIIER